MNLMLWVFCLTELDQEREKKHFAFLIILSFPIFLFFLTVNVSQVFEATRVSSIEIENRSSNKEIILTCVHLKLYHCIFIVVGILSKSNNNNQRQN